MEGAIKQGNQMVIAAKLFTIPVTFVLFRQPGNKVPGDKRKYLIEDRLSGKKSTFGHG